MHPLAPMCSIHGAWLTPVATRTLAGVRHAEDFDTVVRNVQATRALLLDEEPAGAIDVLWLQDLCTARTHVQLPWGKSRPHDLIRLVDALAREVICASNVDDRTLRPSADHRELFAKDFAFETAAGQRVVMSLPTRLRRRQWVLARVAHVLRRPPEARTFYSSWSAASVQRLASMRDWPDAMLAWVCPKAAELARRQDELRRKFSISPMYFKACSALLASFQ